MDTQSPLREGYEKEPAPPIGLVESPYKQTYFEHKRLAFWRKPDIIDDVVAYSTNDTQHAYGPIKFGKFDKPLDNPFWGYQNKVDKETGVKDALNIRRGDTEKDVLIIGNRNSWHTGQYNTAEDKRKASMSFIHLMAIPTQRVFNSVSLPDATLITKMKQEFITSWPEIKTDAIEMQRIAMERAAVAGGNDKVPEQIQLDYEAMVKLAEELTVNDFVFGFHIAPDCSVPHLHMHIIAVKPGLRQFSTHEHDRKTVLIEDITPIVQQPLPLDGVIGAEKLTEDSEWTRRLLLGLVKPSVSPSANL